MELNQRRVIESLAAAVGILLLILIIILVLGVANAKTESETNIINSYNVNSFNYPVEQPNYLQAQNTKPYLVDLYDGRAKVYTVPSDLRYASPEKRYLNYYHKSALETNGGIFGNVHNYNVYLTNRDYVGGYFKVVYHFEDYYGREKSYAVTKYVPALEEKMFFFRDVNPSEYKYRRWWYTVSPLTKVPGKVYYNDYPAYNQPNNYFYVN